MWSRVDFQEQHGESLWLFFDVRHLRGKVPRAVLLRHGRGTRNEVSSNLRHRCVQGGAYESMRAHD